MVSEADRVHRFMDSVLFSFVLSNIKTVLRAFLIAARRTSVCASSLSLTVPLLDSAADEINAISGLISESRLIVL